MNLAENPLPPPSFSHLRLLVVGDVMLDRYWFGAVDRISPEAPVPVVHVAAEATHQQQRLGGAANVARNIQALLQHGRDCHVTLLGLCGQDEAGTQLKTQLNDTGIRTELLSDENFPTIVKLRVLARQQQLIRIDFEQPPSPELTHTLLERFGEIAANHDVIIFSDYAKGALTHVAAMIQHAKSLGKLVLVDPKGTDFAKYAGADCLTPNRGELKAVIGNWQTEASLEQQVSVLCTQHHFEHLLLTRSEEGMTLFSPHTAQPPIHVATAAQEVFDVSGAGDTVIATLAVMLAAGQDWATAIHYANRAAGIVVGKVGTAVVSAEELLL
jgi:rfaE bifunctional protein kinase chain/domain